MKLISAVTLTIVCMLSVFGQNRTDRDIAERSTPGITLNNVTIVNAATNALHLSGVPGGVATESDCVSPANYNLLPRGETLRDVFNAIVNADPSYRWKIEDGVLDLTQVHDKGTLLDTLLHDVTVKDAQTAEDIVNVLLTNPEIHETALRLQIQEGIRPIGLQSLERPGSSKSGKKGLNIHLQDVTLRAALNAVAYQHGTAVWRYDQRHCGDIREFSISFLVW